MQGPLENHALRNIFLALWLNRIKYYILELAADCRYNFIMCQMIKAFLADDVIPSNGLCQVEQLPVQLLANQQ